MSGIPGKLAVGPDGKLTGPAHITYNDPWPLKFAGAGVTGQMDGVVEHTIDGTLGSCIATFNGPNPAGSAHLAIGTTGADDGRIHQFVPFGQGYETYHAFAANGTFYGFETEDGGHPQTPISEKGLWAWAQCLEFASRFAGFPLQVLAGGIAGARGLGYHRQFAAWNRSGHTCPGATMTDMVRVNQRAEIVRRAHLIRAGGPLPSGRYSADGQTSMAQLAQRQGYDVAEIWFETASLNTEHGIAEFGPLQREYLNAGLWSHDMPSGMLLDLP